MERNEKQKLNQHCDEKDGPRLQSGANFMDWKFILVVCIFVGTKQYFDYQHKLTNQKKVNITQDLNTVSSRATDDEKVSFQYVESILLSEMTAEEKEKNSLVLSKMANNSATKQDLVDKGKILDAVLGRLPNEKKMIVEKFFDNARRQYGDELQRELNQ